MKKFGKILSLLMLPLLVEIIYSTLKGFVLNSVPIWSFEVTLFLYGMLFMLGGAVCHMEKKHVSVEVLGNFVSASTKRVLDIVSESVVFFTAAIMLYVSIPTAYKSTLLMERSTHQTPFNPYIWWYRWVIPISCALLLYQAGKDLLALIIGKKTTEKIEEAQRVA
jgi:TRAP-type C4-dicarboxylate transport system permease small subunit